MEAVWQPLRRVAAVLCSQMASLSLEKMGGNAYPQIILFGDSITQQAEATFAADLRNRYVRRADIVNRGFSGYTSSLALEVLPKFFPDPGQTHVRWMTIFFGANDACLPGSAQYVPIWRYMESLKALVGWVRERAKVVKVVLITPGPVNEWQLLTDERTAANTKKYAEACRQVGSELRVPVVDLWSIFMKKAGWVEGKPLEGSKELPNNAVLQSLLSDGLHFNPAACSIVFDELMSTIAQALPEEVPDKLPFVFPEWSALLKNPWCLQKASYDDVASPNTSGDAV